MIAVGEQIKKIREIRGLTQENIAKQLNITPQAYSKIERGDTNIDIHRLKQIADALGVSVEDILRFDEKKLFVNTQKQEGENNEGSFTLNLNFSESNNKAIEVLEKIIAQQFEEIVFLRKQLASFINQTNDNTFQK